MSENKKGCGCSPLSRFDMCDEDTTTTSSDTEIVMDATTIEPTDQLIFVRKNCKETRVFQSSLKNLSPKTALLILSKAVQEMPQSDPGDGFTLWNDDGFIRVAGGVEQQGRIGAGAFIASLEEVLKILPKTNPNNGLPWNNGGFLVQGTNTNTNTNKD